MFVRVRKPSSRVLEGLVERVGTSDPTYPEVGATADADLPRGYRHDLYEVTLGQTAVVFDRAVEGLRIWQAHMGAGLEVVPREAPIVANTDVLLMLRLGGLWTVAPCRIVYVVEQADRFGFAYGTLPGHPEAGEAAFIVTRDEAEGVVFRIRSFSRPADPLARAAAPISRRVQKIVTQKYIDALARFTRANP